ncbi:MAG: ATPase domain-containing protein, partial [Bacteroidota bacterium]
MAKVKTSFFCQNCGAQSAKWIGKCPSCQQWNTYSEEIIETTSVKSSNRQTSKPQTSKPRLIAEIQYKEEKRFDSGSIELNRVLGGGIVPGALILVGGEPGIGKSTLMLQIALSIKSKRTLYISGEESEIQIKMRAERLGLLHSECYILTETQ